MIGDNPRIKTIGIQAQALAFPIGEDNQALETWFRTCGSLKALPEEDMCERP